MQKIKKINAKLSLTKKSKINYFIKHNSECLTTVYKTTNFNKSKPIYWLDLAVNQSIMAKKTRFKPLKKITQH